MYFDPYENTSKLSPELCLPIEIIVILIYVVDCVLRLQTARNKLCSNHRWLMIKVTLCCLFIADIILCYLYMRPANVAYYKGRNLTLPNLIGYWGLDNGVNQTVLITDVDPTLGKIIQKNKKTKKTKNIKNIKNINITIHIYPEIRNLLTLFSLLFSLLLFVIFYFLLIFYLYFLL